MLVLAFHRGLHVWKEIQKQDGEHIYENVLKLIHTFLSVPMKTQSSHFCKVSPTNFGSISILKYCDYTPAARVYRLNADCGFTQF